MICFRHVLTYLSSVCSHSILMDTFRPKTNITMYSSLANDTATSIGYRSQRLAHELSWTILNLGKTVSPDRCCSSCNPALLTPLEPSGIDDMRLYAFANDFIHPIAHPPSGPPSAMSHLSVSSTTTIAFEPVKDPNPISKPDKAKLHKMLMSWLDVCHAQRGSSLFISRDFGLPPKQMDKIVENCGKFLSSRLIGKKEILKVIKLDFALETDFEDIASTISEWRDGLQIRRTPQSQRCTQKKSRQAAVSSTPLLQSDFGSQTGGPSATPARLNPQPGMFSKSFRIQSH